MVHQVVVAEADRRREDDRDIGADRAQPVGVRGPKHDVVRVVVDQNEKRMVGEGAYHIGCQDDCPPWRINDRQSDSDGDLQRDQQHCPQCRPYVGLE